MQAKLSKEGDVVVVHLMGRLDIETAEPFRKVCLDRLLSEKVVFNFKDLSFVGSSGIIPFLEAMKSFALTNPNGMKFSGVSSEFRKVFAATPLNTIEIFDNESMAAIAFSQAQQPASVPAAIIAAPLKPTTLSPQEESFFIEAAVADESDSDEGGEA